MIKKTIAYLLLSGLAFLSACSQPTASESADMDQFLDELLNKMTLEEKIGQTVLYTSGYDVVTGPTVDPNYRDYLKKGMVGGIFNAVGSAYIRSLQKMAVEETRLGIPLIFGYDVIHGQRTIFPIPLAESCSWDLEAMERSAQVAASEATAEGINWIYAPMVDISRDPRWGRVAEGAGEDVYLGSLIAHARTKGFQGKSLSDANTVVACVKHYTAYGATMAGRDYNTVDIGENELWNTYLPPFKAAIDAGSASIMTAFNDLNGIPATGNAHLLKDILRDTWKFEGMVVTDYTSINEMIQHGYAADEKHAAEIAINAGVDMDMQGGVFMNHLKQLTEENKVNEEEITRAARNVLKIKYKLGLFDDPYKYCSLEREKNEIFTGANKEAARDMARKSMVLLKNENQTLPLKPNQKVALIGPLAKDKYEILGCWSAMGERDTIPVSVYEGLSEAIGKNQISYAKGCDIQSEDRSGFAEAVKIAASADVVIMVMGEFHNMSGENNSRTDISLPGVQLELLKAVKKTGKPVVMVMYNGRPLTINWEKENLDAILEAWFPGTMGGAAVADVLTGKYNPSGKLTMTFPQNVGQIPLFYNHKNTGRPYDPQNPQLAYGAKYWDVSNEPLYPFGYGLSYTSFSYTDFKISAETLTAEEPLTVSVNLTNTGNYDGEEIVQLYTRDMVASVTRPVKELKKFRKIALKKGETKTIEFMLTVDDLRFYNPRLEYVYEEGDFHLFVGTDSQTKMMKKFVLKD